MSYIPKPGDKVKIVDLHKYDAFYDQRDQFIGKTITVKDTMSIKQNELGYASLEGDDEDGFNWCFYAAKVEPVSN
jgi:hypothetical protein